MKVLSKYLKVALCFIAFAFCSFMFAFTPTFTAVQAAELTSVSYEKALSAIKMPNVDVDYSKGDKFNIPLLNSTGFSASYKIRVVDPSGYNHDYTVGTSQNDNFFTLDSANGMVKVNAANSGEYKVIYIVTNGNRTYYSNSYSVNVSNVSYELDFSTPVLKSGTVVGYTKNLIKTTLAQSTVAYELPVAYAKQAGEELTVVDGVVTNQKATIKVTKNGAPQEENEEGSVFTSSDGKFYITPSEVGVYTVEYTFEDSENRPTKTYTISVEESYTPSDLKLATKPTMPTIELGKTITLPEITVNAGDDANVDVNVESIRIEKEGSNGAIYCELTNNNFEYVMSPENFEGVDNYADMVGNYRITYTVKGVYDTQELTETFHVSGVTASSNPTIKLAYNYDTTATYEADDIIFGAETDLKAEYESDAGFVLPAVYVEDAVTTNYSDFTIVRMIKKGSTYYYLDNKKYDEDSDTLIDVASTDKGYNASGDANIGKTNKAVTFKFNSNATNIEGTYELVYRVITNQVKEREAYLYVDGTSEKYSFQVVASGSHKETTPTVEITNLKDSSVKNTDSVTVKVSSVDDKDTRLKNAVFTYSATPTNLQEGDTFTSILQAEIDNLLNAIGTDKESHIFNDSRLYDGWEIGTTSGKGLKYYFSDIKLVDESETKNSFNLDLSAQTAGNVNVLAVAINDDGNIAVDTKVLTIKDTTNDSTAPTMNVYVSHLEGTQWLNASNGIQEFTVGQGVDVKLPTVYVADDADKTLMLDVMYYIDSPENSYGGIKYLSPANKSFYYDNELFETEVQVIDGGTITTSETGIYYVAYTATDVAGNTSVMYFTFEVKDTSKPILSVQPVSGDEITISGNTVTAGKGTVIDFETTLKSADGKEDYTSNQNIKISIKDNGLSYQPSGNSRTSYVFYSYGTYIVTISGKYDTTLNDEAMTLEADSKTIKVVIEKQDIEWLGEFDVTQYATTGETVKLPDVAASNGAVVKVTYTLPGDSEDEALEATKVTETSGYSYWTFTTDDSANGTYKVTYTATTDEDVLTKTISIKVGDNVPPTIDVGNKTKAQQQLVYDGENDIEYLVEVNKTKTSTTNRYFKVTVTNNGEVVYSEDLNLTITDKDDIGSTNTSLSWKSLSYELTGPSVSTGESATNRSQYLISGTGKYTLKISVTDTYDNVGTATIEFNVVSKSSAKENKDNVVGAVLIVITLLLVAASIVFFTFSGKKGGSNKTKKVKVAKSKKTEKVEESNVEFVEDVKTEEADDEPKSGDVE